MKDLLIGVAAAATALAGILALTLPRLLDVARLKKKYLEELSLNQGEATARAEHVVWLGQVLAVGGALALAFLCSVAALFVGGQDTRAADETAGSQSRCDRSVARRSTARRGVATGANDGRAREAARRSRRGRRNRAGRPAQRAVGTPTIVAIGAQGQPVTGPVSLRMALGSEREVVERRQTFRVNGVRARDVRAAIVNDFKTANGDGVMPIAERQLTARVAPVGASRRLVQVYVCYDPARPSEISPGSYTGGLIVLAGRASPVPLGLTITARDSRIWAGVLAAVLGLIAGILVRIGADRRWGPVEIDRAYLFNFRFWVMVGGGVTAAVYSYLTIFADDPVFDGSMSSLWQLTAQTFAGTLASKAVTDLIGPTGKEIEGRRARKQTLIRASDSSITAAQGGRG